MPFQNLLYLFLQLLCMLSECYKMLQVSATKLDFLLGVAHTSTKGVEAQKFMVSWRSSGRYHAECHQITAAPCRLAAAATSAAAGTSCWDRSHNLVAWAARGL